LFNGLEWVDRDLRHARPFAVRRTEAGHGAIFGGLRLTQ
jgi:hypothetical protein